MLASTAPLRVDTHTHILPRDWPAFQETFGYAGFIRLEHHVDGWARMMKNDPPPVDGEKSATSTFFREVEEDLWDMDARLAYMDQTGIDVQVACTVPVMFSYWARPEDTLHVARVLNDDLAEKVQDHPTRFVGLGTLPMQAPELAVREVKRAVAKGLAGFQIGSHIEDMTLDDPKLFPIFEAIADAGACLMVHPWDMMGKDRMKKYWLPWLVSMPAETSLAVCSLIFGGIFQRLPHLRVLYAHAGGSFPATVGRVKHGFDCRPDLCATDNKICPTEYMGQFWIDHLTHSKEQLRYVIDLVGEDRVCFGTDYPFPLGETYPLKKPGENIDALDLGVDAHTDLEIKARLLGKNACEWLYGRENAEAWHTKFMASPHRASKRSEALIIAKHAPELAGTYSCEDGVGEVVLSANGAVSLRGITIPGEVMQQTPVGIKAEQALAAGHDLMAVPPPVKGITTTGDWRVATYDRVGRPQHDIVVTIRAAALPTGAGVVLTAEAEVKSKATADVLAYKPKLRQRSLLGRSEWEKSADYRSFNVMLVPHDEGRVARFVRTFPFSHLKRTSGHNDLIEGQKVALEN